MKSNLILSGSFLCFCLLIGVGQAADLSENQLIAVQSDNPPICFDDGEAIRCERPFYNLEELKVYLQNIHHLNVLVATGASMTQTGQPQDLNFDPFRITFFGRTTVSRPVPDLRNQAQYGLDLRAGVRNTVLMTGSASLLDALTGAQIASAPAYNERDDWALSKGEYQRPTTSGQVSQLYVVRHNVTLSLPVGWSWLYVPATCTATSASSVTCSEKSVPFYIGPNPGEPQG